jgi:diguanylate cyclase (GGDEF)-like protein
VQKRVERLDRPEYALGAVWLFAQLITVPAIALASGPRVYMLPMYIFPTLIGCVVFPLRAAVIGTIASVLIMVATGLGVTTHDVLALPPTLIYPAVTLICAAIWASAIRDADIESRSTAVVDQLTGALNRTALAARVAELGHHGSVGGAPVAILLGDLDNFKAINDAHGHATGDAVLAEAAQRMQTCLGAFESVYRIGGEEFVVLLPNIDADQGLRMAERLRTAVSAEPIEGIPVTISFGVTATAPGEPFHYEPLFARADGALYEAKRRGRDQSCVVLDAPPAAAAPSPRPADRRRGDVSPASGPAAGERWRDHIVEERARTGSWLIQDGLQRAHMLDLLRRIDRVGHSGNLLIIGALAAAGPYFGWWPILPLVLAGAGLQAVESSLERFRRPEYALGLAWVAACIVYAFSYFLATKPPVAALPLMVLMNVGFSAVFPVRGVAVGAAVQALLMAAVGFGACTHEVLSHPALLVLPLALLGAAALVGTAVGQSALEHRGAAVVDSLTGLLNRAALDARAAELQHQAALTGEPLALILGDLDSFKSINDRHGHAVGDAVLQEVAARLRAQVRAFDSIYRLGGDEFVVLLPGVAWEGAVELGERLREAVSAEPLHGVEVTISLGAAARSPGDPRNFAELFDAADRALYDAKHRGRDRVEAEALAELVVS